MEPSLGAGEPMDDLDLRILEEVRELYESLDPVPQGLTQRVKFALTVQALHAEVAELTQSAQLAVRSEATETEMVTFTRGDVSMLVRFGRRSAGTVDLDAWVTLPGARIELQIGNDLRTATADERGRLEFLEVPRGPANFVIWAQGSTSNPIVTPTIEL